MKGSLEQRWSSHFARVAMNVAKGMRSVNHRGNKFGLLRLDLSSLTRSGWYYLRLDKAPGYGLLPTEQLSAVEALALPPTLYQPIFTSNLNIRAAVSEYRKIASNIATSCSDPRIASAIISSLRTGLYVTPISTKIKSHKPVGEVSVRTIHRGLRPCWSGLSRWVVSVLEPIISSLAWLAPDTHTARRMIKASVPC